MFNRVLYKKQAKMSLKGRKKQTALISLIPVIVSILLYIVYMTVFFELRGTMYYSSHIILPIMLMCIVCIVFSAAMSLVSFAYLRTINDMQDQKPVGVKTVLAKFTPKAIPAMLWIILWQLIWGIPLIIGIIIFTAAAETSYLFPNLFAWTLTMASGIVLCIAGFIIFYAKLLSYSLMFFILADNPELNIRKVMRLSIAVTKGSRENILVMILSFYGWMFLGIFTLGIGFLWVCPYVTMAIRNAYIALKNNVISENILKASDFTVHKKLKNTAPAEAAGTETAPETNA